jgi:hypothetical protein
VLRPHEVLECLRMNGRGGIEKEDGRTVVCIVRRLAHMEL